MIEKQKPGNENAGRDPYEALWPKLMADPEIAPPGSWSVKYYPKERKYEFVIHQYPGFNAAQAPIHYDADLYGQNMARLFRAIVNALQREDQSHGDVPSMDVLKKILQRSKKSETEDEAGD